MKLITCQSVVGGWQTFSALYDMLIGPVFNKTTDLWDWQKENLQNDSDLQDEVEKVLLKRLPHGSGIDCKWEFKWLKNGKVKASNSFHCMNDAGYYDGYADFTVIITPTYDLGDFKLVFNGRQGQNKNRQYMLRDYLEDTLYQALKYPAV